MGTLAENAKLRAASSATANEFGISVALSGDILAVGVDRHDKIANDSGAVYMYEKTRHGWIDTTRERKILKAPDAQSGAHFGNSVAVSGGTVVVGAKDTNDSAGAAYIFRDRSASGSNINIPVIMYLLN